jgi:hypothetical protein
MHRSQSPNTFFADRIRPIEMTTQVTEMEIISFLNSASTKEGKIPIDATWPTEERSMDGSKRGPDHAVLSPGLAIPTMQESIREHFSSLVQDCPPGELEAFLHGTSCCVCPILCQDVCADSIPLIRYMSKDIIKILYECVIDYDMTHFTVVELPKRRVRDNSTRHSQASLLSSLLLGHTEYLQPYRGLCLF